MKNQGTFNFMSWELHSREKTDNRARGAGKCHICRYRISIRVKLTDTNRVLRIVYVQRHLFRYRFDSS